MGIALPAAKCMKIASQRLLYAQNYDKTDEQIKDEDESNGTLNPINFLRIF